MRMAGLLPAETTRQLQRKAVQDESADRSQQSLRRCPILGRRRGCAERRRELDVELAAQGLEAMKA